MTDKFSFVKRMLDIQQGIMANALTQRALTGTSPATQAQYTIVVESSKVIIRTLGTMLDEMARAEA